MTFTQIEQTYEDITEEKARKLTQLLQADVQWLLTKERNAFGQYSRNNFNPNQGLFFDGKDGGCWQDAGCGTCIIGAHLLRTQPPNPNADSDYVIFARQHGLTEHQARAIYTSAFCGTDAEHHPRCARVAIDVITFAMNEFGWHPEDVEDEPPFTMEKFEEFTELVEEYGGWA
jgi:hypothetical protein